MRHQTIKNFTKGLVTRVEDFSIPEDAASASLNWLTLGDKIELSGGYRVIGTENGAGKITGLKVGEKVNGDKMALRTRGQKLEYYNTATSDWVEIGSNLLGSAADGEDTSIEFYTSLAGYQAWVSSPNSGLFKVMLANAAAKDMYDATENFKGYLLSQNGRLLLWYRLNNKNYLYGSYKDVQNTAVYTTVSGEAVGAGGSTNYSGTLAAVTGKRTCFGVTITDGTTTLTDDKNGAFTGAGTGTINYATGAYDVTFTNPTVGSVTASYQWEDSTEKGLADFTFSSTRLATEGFFLPQPTGGDLLNVSAYRTEFYCLHETNAWLFSMPVDDLSPTNQVFRENIGLSSARAAVPTGDGIYYIDTANPSQPRFKLLTLGGNNNDQVVPIEFSFNVDLSGYDFSAGVGYKWGDYIIFEGKTADSAVNNRMFAFHAAYKTFDVLDYRANCLADYTGDLWAGEPTTDNVTQLFYGHTANGSIIPNHWEGKLSQLEVDELKKFKRFSVRGFIGSGQSIKISLAYDNGAFQEIGTIDGDGDYVNRSVVGLVGATMVGVDEVGGGSSGIDASPYVREFRVRSRKFDKVKVRVEAMNVGYASVTELAFSDIQTYGQRNLTRFRATS